MALKIIATVRTRNEEANIARFCDAYRGTADEIIVADGGSRDATVEIANQQAKTTVLYFPDEMQAQGGHRINPQGKHTNYLIKYATARGADWIIFDDCDCVPNFVLRPQVRELIERTEREGKVAIFARRVYMWGTELHFPLLHEAGTSLWAFRADTGVNADESDPWHLKMRWHNEGNLTDLRPLAAHLEFPECLLHFTWPSEEATQEKLEYYRMSGVQPGAKHPHDFAGPRKPIQDFMRVAAPIE